MGKDSDYYREKSYLQKEKLTELLYELPDFAKKYINDKRLKTQTSTLISYCYDLMTFYNYLLEKNPYFRKHRSTIKEFTYDDMKTCFILNLMHLQRTILTLQSMKTANVQSHVKWLRYAVCSSFTLSMVILIQIR